MITFSSSSLIGFHQNKVCNDHFVFKVIYPVPVLSDEGDGIIDIDGESLIHHHYTEIWSPVTGLPSVAPTSLCRNPLIPALFIGDESDQETAGLMKREKTNHRF